MKNKLLNILYDHETYKVFHSIIVNSEFDEMLLPGNKNRDRIIENVIELMQSYIASIENKVVQLQEPLLLIGDKLSGEVIALHFSESFLVQVREEFFAQESTRSWIRYFLCFLFRQRYCIDNDIYLASRFPIELVTCKPNDFSGDDFAQIVREAEQVG